MKLRFILYAATLIATLYSCRHPAETVTDIDGNVYKTVKIGLQSWMAENLKVTKFSNGDPIPNITGGSEWRALTKGAYCNYNNDTSSASVYGRLYNWYAVNDSRSIAPTGWHLPTNAEWAAMQAFLGVENTKGLDTISGGRLKEAGTAHWDNPNTGADNESGFSALPGGIRFGSGEAAFYNIRSSGVWWTNTAMTDSIAYNHGLARGSAGCYLSFGSKKDGCSVRCIKD